MSKAIGMAKLSAKGGLHLFLGLTVSSGVSAVGVILLMRLMNPSEYGLVVIALISPSLIGLLRDWGVNWALLRFVAQYRSANRSSEIRESIASGLLFELGLGGVLSLTSFLLAGFLATNVFHRPETKALIEIGSLIILAGSLLKVSDAVFIGFERMEYSSLIMICQSSLKTFLAPLLVYLGYSSLGAVAGQTIALAVSALVGFLIFYLAFFRRIDRKKEEERGFTATLKIMLRYGLPLSVPTIMGGLLPQFYTFLLALYGSDAAIGNFQAAVNFTVLIIFFTAPVSTVLFPAFSKLKRDKELEPLKTVFTFSVRYAAMLVVPVATMIMVLSQPLVFAIAGEKWREAPFYLALYSISYLYAGLGSLSFRNFLNGQGQTRVTMKLAILSGVVGLSLGLTLIPFFKVTGLIITTLGMALPSLVAGLWWIKKHYGITIDWPSSAKIFLAAALAAAVTYIIIYFLSFNYWIELFAGAIIFMASYLTIAPITRAVDQNDVNNLKVILSDIGPLAHLFRIPINIIERILKLAIS